MIMNFETSLHNNNNRDKEFYQIQATNSNTTPLKNVPCQFKETNITTEDLTHFTIPSTPFPPDKNMLQLSMSPLFYHHMNNDTTLDSFLYSKPQNESIIQNLEQNEERRKEQEEKKKEDFSVAIPSFSGHSSFWDHSSTLNNLNNGSISVINKNDTNKKIDNIPISGKQSHPDLSITTKEPFWEPPSTLPVKEDFRDNKSLSSPIDLKSSYYSRIMNVIHLNRRNPKTHNHNNHNYHSNNIKNSITKHRLHHCRRKTMMKNGFNKEISTLVKKQISSTNNLRNKNKLKNNHQNIKNNVINGFQSDTSTSAINLVLSKHNNFNDSKIISKSKINYKNNNHNNIKFKNFNDHFTPNDDNKVPKNKTTDLNNEKKLGSFKSLGPIRRRKHSRNYDAHVSRFLRVGINSYSSSLKHSH